MLPYVPLDLGQHSSARSVPMAAAQFGAEAGAYSLVSNTVAQPDPQLIPPISPFPPPLPLPTPLGDTDAYNASLHQAPGCDAPLKKGAIVWKISNAEEQCGTLSMDTYLACTTHSVIGTARDLWNREKPLLQTFQENKRYVYLLVLLLVAFLLYKIGR